MKYPATIALLLCSALTKAQNEVSFSRELKVAVVVDGHSTDWEKPFNFFDNKTRLYFGIANDKDYLYLCFESPEPANHYKIIKTGLELSISTKSKKKVNCTINFPLSNKIGAVIGNPQLDMLTLHKEALENQMLLASGFQFQNGLIESKSKDIEVVINWDSEENMIIEYKISLKGIFGSDFDIKNFDDPILLKADVKGFQKPGGNVSSFANSASNRSAADGSLGMNSNSIIGGGMNQNPMMGMQNPNMMGGPNQMMGQNQMPVADDNSDNNQNTESPRYSGFLFERAELKQRFVLNK
jgi:hypothetical protein